jgi:hypothetical protein
VSVEPPGAPLPVLLEGFVEPAVGDGLVRCGVAAPGAAAGGAAEAEADADGAGVGVDGTTTGPDDGCGRNGGAAFSASVLSMSGPAVIAARVGRDARTTSRPTTRM